MNRVRYSVIADAIRKHYKGLPGAKLASKPPEFVREMVLSMEASGLGDCVIMSDMRRDNDKVFFWAATPTFHSLMKYCPSYKHKESSFYCNGLRLVLRYDCGPGHHIQQFRRIYGLDVPLKPAGHLVHPGPRRKDRVILHFEPASGSAANQRATLHPRMRELYPESKVQLEKFITENQDLEFIQVGFKNLGIVGSTYVVTPTLDNLLAVIQSGSWFIGISSGPLNVAVALGLRCISVVNYPKPSELVLPNLKVSHRADENWNYPQNVHLHQDGESRLVPRLSAESLNAAFNGEVYPFWSDYFLNLVEDAT